MGATRLQFETYTRYFGVDEEKQIYVLGSFNGSFLRNLGGSHSFFNLFKRGP